MAESKKIAGEVVGLTEGALRAAGKLSRQLLISRRLTRSHEKRWRSGRLFWDWTPEEGFPLCPLEYFAAVKHGPLAYPQFMKNGWLFIMGAVRTLP